MKRLRNENDFIACVMYWHGFKNKNLILKIKI